MLQGCTLGKYAKVAFPRSEGKFKGVLELIYLDVHGPMLVESMIVYPRGLRYTS